jgi:hypothetical protein
VQDSYKVEGSACETRIAQGLFNENATAGPWISDPTAMYARVCGELHYAPGARVHGGPHRRGIPLISLASWISDPTIQDVCRREWRRARRSAAACGGGLTDAALDRAAVHQNFHGRVQNVARLHAHSIGESRGSPVPHRRPAPERGGAATPARSRMRR